MQAARSDAVAIVTGGTRGIGAAIAKRLAQQSFRVAVLARSERDVAQVAANLNNLGAHGPTSPVAPASPPSPRVPTTTTRPETPASEGNPASAARHVGIACDLRNPEAVQRAIAAVKSQLGLASVLVNAAGIVSDNLLVKTPHADMASVLETNLVGPMLTCKEVVPHMLRLRSGCIINIGSVVGLVGNPGQTVYAASKAGLVGLTKSLALELASQHSRQRRVTWLH
ncbi:short chain dehydrogenase [Capsaspora owczarzaki ATCC 30864]|uniref:Short chain dehydrogenase n=1 Tax=Capsaspora owczarzaki (strain ATCC 30864) TaxID=595528 RepID=A0A0D2WHV6_CAPO3|nr:short chain dehydrogenase [Capsaspora owczarzaki ATCC 30864]KJE88413.1 short chain dehydrogenase [Capsaspora owczarzaki ATCC 30864]|eukprot:XP_004364942.2 short chain dehydrogenase [Capsaspora owczarzaki ATCC 30864]